ncbi:MAG: zf-HC2 domain-containing protein [Gaiellaceae bacterium]
MQPDSNCEQTRALIPELALGIADGRERADALEHIATCPGCRRALEGLSQLADELLLLAPSEEPPAGFESRVLERLDVRPARFPRARRPLALVAAVLTAAALGATGTFLALGEDRDVASQYRAALERVGGEYFEAAQLHAADGTPVGKVFGYQGRPSWLLVVVYRDFRAGSFRAGIVTRDGRQVPLPSLDVGSGSWGGSIAIPFREVALVRLSRDDGAVFEARLPPP